jgi:hypothetical protein
MHQRRVGNASGQLARAGLAALAVTGLVGTAHAEPCDPAHPCTFQIVDQPIQKVPAVFKFQSRVAQSKIPVGDATFAKIIVNIKRDTQTLCREEFTNVRVQDSVLNLEIGRQISCELDEVIAENPDLYFQVCIGGDENCLKPVQVGTTPYAVKANFAAQTNEAHRADVAAQAHYAHRATADRDMFVTNQVGKGYFDFHTPPSGGAVYPDNATFAPYKDSGFIGWSAVDPTGNKLTVAGKNPGNDTMRPLTDVQVAAASTTLQGDGTVAHDLTVGNDAAVMGNADVAGNTHVGGLMSVDGDTTLASNMSVGINASVAGNTTVGGTLGVTGATTLGNTLRVTGDVTALSDASVAQDLAVGGNADVTGAADIGGNTTVGGTLGVTGATTMQSTLNVAGNMVGGQGLALTGNVSAQNATMRGTSTLQGNTTVGGTLGVTGATTMAGLTASSANVTNNVSVGGNGTVTGTLGVTGAATVGGLTNNGNLTSGQNVTLATADGTLMTVGTSGRANKGAVVFNWPVNFTDNVNITGAVAYTPTDNSIFTNHIAAGQVQNSDLSADAVTTDKIADGAVGAADLAADSVTSAKIATGAVGTTDIADGAVTLAKLAPLSVDATKIADGSVTLAKMAALSVDATKLTDNAVTSAKITDGAVGTADLASNAVTTVKITDANVTTAKLADNAVTTAKIADGAVGTADLAAAAVTIAKMAAYAVDATILADNAVTTAKLANGAVTESKLATGAVTNIKIGTAAVNAEKIADNAVTSAKINDGTITQADMTPGLFVPIGAILDWYCTPALPTSASCNVPAGFLRCEGQVVNDAASPLNGKTLPDFRGRYALGDPSAGAVVGSWGHNHTVTVEPANAPHQHQWGEAVTVVRNEFRTWDAAGNKYMLGDVPTVGGYTHAAGGQNFGALFDKALVPENLYTSTHNASHNHAATIAAADHRPPSIMVMKIMRVK